MTYVSPEERRRILNNSLVSMGQAISNLQNKPMTWDARIALLQELTKVIPLVVRLMIYFKNTEIK